MRVLISSKILSLDEIRDLNCYDNLRNPESFRDNEIPRVGREKKPKRNNIVGKRV